MIPWSATIFSLVGIFFNAKKRILCWPIWLIGSLLWAGYALWGFPTIHWPELILWSAFCCTNIYGWYCWMKEV